MRELTIRSTHTQTVALFISCGLSTRAMTLFEHPNWSSIHVIYDVSVAEAGLRLAKQFGTSHTIEITHPEQMKSFAGLESICTQLLAQKADRHSLVVNVGGGALSDIGGFAASVYMRGIDYVNIPTTVLAQVDASVGGKTAINLGGVKNLIGSFTQPIAIIIDPELTQGLSDREFASGCSEMLKHGLIASTPYWETLRSTTPQQLRSNMTQLEEAIYQSICIKDAIASGDIYESGDRKKLNFGHTIGHAIESLSHTTDSPYLHGEAVSIGMIAEAELSDLSHDEKKAIATTLTAYGLPTKLRDRWDKGAIQKLLKSDKKNNSGTVKWTLLQDIGNAVYDQSRDEGAVQAALETILP